jgi:hypothetical protein
MASKGGGKSGLQAGEGGMMDPGLGSGQDGFNIPSHVTSYKENPCTSPQVGRDSATATDPRGRGANPKKGS